jgi:hypothetical protein
MVPLDVDEAHRTPERLAQAAGEIDLEPDQLVAAPKCHWRRFGGHADDERGDLALRGSRPPAASGEREGHEPDQHRALHDRGLYSVTTLAVKPAPLR